MKPITVFTPAYNRADLLPRCYESMKKQTNQNFIWMVIDDGSTDHTASLIQEYMNASHEFEIEYYFKENGGLHTAYNKAIAHIKTPLCVCIDSDDWMPEDAIEKILYFWDEHGSDQYAGIVGLDCFENGEIIGDKFPNQKSINLIDLMTGRYKIKNGDRTNVVRTELYKEVAPMKSFPGEKNFNPHYMHLQISLKYDFLVMNENLHFVEYQPGGMSDSMLKQYRNSPNSFAEFRRLQMQFPDVPIMFCIKTAIHYGTECMLAKRDIFRGLSLKYMCLCTITLPSILLLYLYILYKTK